MARMRSMAGWKFYIGNAAMDDKDAAFTASDFSSVTWTEVKGWVTAGASGDAAALVTSDQISVARTKKAKAARNAGTMENVFDALPDDAGQLAMIAAQGDDENYPFRVVRNDAPITGASPKPGERLFIGLVMSETESGGGPNDPWRRTFTVEINSNLVTVAPSAT